MLVKWYIRTWLPFTACLRIFSFEFMLGSSHPEVVCKKLVLKNFEGKHLCRSSVSKRVACELPEIFGSKIDFIMFKDTHREKGP